MGGVVSTSPPQIMPFTMSAIAALMGQGDKPELWALWSFSDAQTDPPVWVSLPPSRVRSFSTSRGRDNERQEIDAGTATVELDNRDRAFDPTYSSGLYYPNVRPRNRVWLREQFNGVTNDLFKGYVESYDQQWPGGGWSDAVTVVEAVDEFKLLNLKRLPAMDPIDAPDYPGVVGSDAPSHYFRWQSRLLMTTTIVDRVQEGATVFTWGPNDPYGSFQWLVTHTAVTEGQGWHDVGGYGLSATTPILGNLTYAGTEPVYGSLQMSSSGNLLKSTDVTAGDMIEKAIGTVELWFKKASTPISSTVFWASPDETGVSNRLWSWQLNNTGTVSFTVRQTGGVSQTVTSPVLADNTWYHLVGVRDGTNLILYVNGVNSASTASSAAWPEANELSLMFVQYPGAAVNLAEMAVYSDKALSAGRVLAHYTAGAARGFPGQFTGTRVGAVLDSVGSHAPRSLRLGTRAPAPAYMANQPVRQALSIPIICEAPDSMFFTSTNGTLTFLDNGHRSVSPWNTVQVTFGDEGGTQIPYTDLDVDYSDSWITNIWSVIGFEDEPQTVSDATSISRYDEVGQTISGMSLSNTDCLAIANAYLAKYKEPLLRGLSLAVTTDDVNATNEVLGLLEIGSKVRVIRTIPKGLGWFDQQMWVQKIEVAGANDLKPWTIRLGVSPL